MSWDIVSTDWGVVSTEFFLLLSWPKQRRDPSEASKAGRPTFVSLWFDVTKQRWQWRWQRFDFHGTMVSLVFSMKRVQPKDKGNPLWKKELGTVVRVGVGQV